MLCLSNEDVFKAADFKDVMECIEHSFIKYEKKEFLMPLRTSVDYHGNTLLLMPCFTEETFGTKMLTLFPGNSSKNLPTIYGLMLLNDSETGKPVMLMSGSALAAIRTGAVGGVAIRHLTHENTETAGLIGTGVQGYYQLLYAAIARPIKKMFVYDRNTNRLKAFIDKLAAELPDVNITAAPSSEEVLKRSEVIITTTTSNEPVLPDNPKLYKGKHFVGIGSYKPTMREYPKALFTEADKIYIDAEDAAKESGDIITPLAEKWINKDKIETFGHFLMSGDTAEKVGDKTILFKSVGIGLFDLMVSDLIYKSAVNKGLGQEINI